MYAIQKINNICHEKGCESLAKKCYVKQFEFFDLEILMMEGNTLTYLHNNRLGPNKRVG